jgi:hypothetical protein
MDLDQEISKIAAVVESMDKKLSLLVNIQQKERAEAEALTSLFQKIDLDVYTSKESPNYHAEMVSPDSI